MIPQRTSRPPWRSTRRPAGCNWLLHGSRLFALLCLASTPIAQVIYVDGTATGAHDGSSWQDACTDVQSALGLAVVGDQVWIAEGTYKPDSGSMNQSASFVLRSGVEMLGGFSGSETSVSQRDPERHPTVLSGDLGGDDDPDSFITNNLTIDNSDHVIVGSDVDATCTLDGFVITGGVGGDFAGACDASVGGGIALRNSSPVIRNCRFVLNRAPFRGGGCYSGSGSAPVFDGCEFFQNVCDYNGGGAMALCDSSPFITECRFEDNRARLDKGAGPAGGAIYAEGSSPAIFRSLFVRNRAYGGGAIAASENSDLTIDASWFIANSAISIGAIGFTASAYDLSSDGVVRDCVFVANEALVFSGAVGIYNSSPHFERCTIFGNSCGFPDHAGGIALADLSLSPSVVIRNCILWNNSAGGTTGAQAQIWDGSESFDIAVSYSCVEGYAPTPDANGNTGLAPTFVDSAGADLILGTEDDDFRLTAGSTGIDQGDPEDPGRGCDALGMPRRLDGDLNATALVDMGAMEFGHVTLSTVDQASSGQVVDVDIQGNGSLQGMLLIGHGSGHTFVGSLGALLFNAQQRWTRVFVGQLPASLQWHIPAQVPSGATFTLQALGVLPSTSIGNSSNAISLTVVDS